MAVSDAFAGGVVGVWLDASPVSNFQTTSTSGVNLTAYSTRAAYSAQFGLWKDLSGNGKNIINATNLGAALNDPAGSWMKVGNLNSDMTTGVGGSTTGFYWAAAIASNNYYGTIFSDQTSGSSADGFRIYFTADGDGVNNKYGFCCNGKAYNSALTGQGDVKINTGSNISVNAGGALYSALGFSVINVLECWYDGSYLYMNINRTGVVKSTSTNTITAGSATAYFNSCAGTDIGSSGTDFYALFMTKNSVPSQATRDQIYDYLVNRSTSGGSRLMTGQSVTVSQGVMTVPSGILLTGQSMTVGRGVMVAAPASPLTGQAVTSSYGAMTPTLSLGLTGQSVTTAYGTVIATFNMPLGGQSMTSFNGVMTPPGTTSVALAGQAMTVGQGALVANVATTALVGRSVTVVLGTPVPAISAAITGQQAVATGGVVSPFNSGWHKTITPTASWSPTPTTQVPGWTSITTVPKNNTGWTKLPT